MLGRNCLGRSNGEMLLGGHGHASTIFHHSCRGTSPLPLTPVVPCVTRVHELHAAWERYTGDAFSTSSSHLDSATFVEVRSS